MSVRRGVAAGVAVTSLVVASGSGCSSAPPGRTPPVFGIDVPRADPAEVERVAGELGCEPSISNAFVKLDSAFDETDLRALAAGGRTPMVSLEPWSWRSVPGRAEVPAYSLRALVRGDHDAALRRIARVLATSPRQVLVRFAHEMNAGWYPWGAGVNGNSAQEYVAAWRHVHAVVGAIAPYLRWVWAPAATWWPDPAALRPFYPGDATVDLLGVTGYGRPDRGLTAEATFGGWYREVRRFSDRPVLLAEIGATGSGASAWIRSLAPFLDDHPDVEGFVWFNTSPATTGATGDYRVDRGAPRTAMRHLLSRTHVPCGAPRQARRTP